jgi:DNA-binding response OmpR family regulator
MSEKNVLIVDDDKSITTVYKMMLEEQGYNVHTASSGKEAISLTEASYDLIILDIKLPDITGDEMANVLKERRMADNIVLMTGFPELRDCIDMLGVGIQEILIKPIAPDEILRVTREAFSSYK